jgi:hypothetical protein
VVVVLFLVVDLVLVPVLLVLPVQEKVMVLNARRDLEITRMGPLAAFLSALPDPPIHPLDKLSQVFIYKEYKLMRMNAGKASEEI